MTETTALTTHIALLRAINLPGHNKVAMADLRALLGGMGFEAVQTLLQSGNVVFRGGRRSPAALEALLEEAARAKLGLTTDFVVRTGPEWEDAIAANPFPAEATRDPGHLLMLCLKAPPGAARGAALQKAITGRERVKVRDRQAYLVYPDGVGHSRLTNAVIEKHLGSRGTGRNWNTVLKLAALVRP